MTEAQQTIPINTVDLNNAVTQIEQTNKELTKESTSKKIIKNVINKFNFILKKADDFLKKNGVLGKGYSNAKEKAKSFFDRTTEGNEEQKTYIGKAVNSVLNMKNMFKRSVSGTDPPVTTTEGMGFLSRGGFAATALGGYLNERFGLSGKLAAVKAFATGEPLESEDSPMDPDAGEETKEKKGILSSLFGSNRTDAEEAQTRAKEEVEREKAETRRAAKNKAKKKSGWLGMLLGGLGTLLGTGITRLLSGMGTISAFLGKHIAKTTLGAIVGLTKVVAKVGWNMVAAIFRSTAGRVAGKIGGKLAELAAKNPGLVRGALQVGRLALMGGGVLAGVAIAGALIYGGYKLYKYLTRNDLNEDLPGKLMRLRFLMYGFNEADKPYFSKLMKLEATVIPLMTYNKTAKIGKISQESYEAIMEAMDIDVTNIDAVQEMKQWYKNRFKPVYEMFASATNSVKPMAKVDDIVDFDKYQMSSLMNYISIPSTLNTYLRKPVPERQAIIVTMDDINKQMSLVKEEVSKNNPDGWDPKTIEYKNEQEAQNIRDNYTRQASANYAADMAKYDKSTVDSSKSYLSSQGMNPDALASMNVDLVDRANKIRAGQIADDAALNDNKSYFDKAMDSFKTTSKPGGFSFIPATSVIGVEDPNKKLNDTDTYRTKKISKQLYNEIMSMDPITEISRAASIFGIDPNLLISIAASESNLNPMAMNPNGGATGLFQFVPDSWYRFVAKYGPRLDMPADANPLNPRYNALMGAAHAFEAQSSNAYAGFIKMGYSPLQANYLVHFFGGPAGQSILDVLKTSPNVDATKLFSESASKTFRDTYRQNPVFFTTRVPTSSGGYVNKPSTVKQLIDNIANVPVNKLAKLKGKSWADVAKNNTWNNNGFKIVLSDNPSSVEEIFKRSKTIKGANGAADTYEYTNNAGSIKANAISKTSVFTGAIPGLDKLKTAAAQPAPKMGGGMTAPTASAAKPKSLADSISSNPTGMSSFSSSSPLASSMASSSSIGQNKPTGAGTIDSSGRVVADNTAYLGNAMDKNNDKMTEQNKILSEQRDALKVIAKAVTGTAGGGNKLLQSNSDSDPSSTSNNSTTQPTPPPQLPVKEVVGSKTAVSMARA